MGSDGPDRPDGGTGGGPEDAAPPLRSVERKILLCGLLVLGGIALAGRFGMLPGAALGAALAYANFVLIRVILEKAFAGGGSVGKGFVVQYVLKFLALAAVVWLVVRSGWFDLVGFLAGLSSLFLGVLLEGLTKSVEAKTK